MSPLVLAVHIRGQILLFVLLPQTYRWHVQIKNLVVVLHGCLRTVCCRKRYQFLDNLRRLQGERSS